MVSVWRGSAVSDVPLSAVLPTDLLQDADDGLLYPATRFFQFAPPPPPQASFEVCYTAPGGGTTCAKATGPGPAIIGAGLLGLALGVFIGVKIA